MERKIKFAILIAVGLLLSASLFTAERWLLGAPQAEDKSEIFVVGQQPTEAEILDKLENQGFIRNKRAFNWVLSFRHLHDKIVPGGYKLSKHMDAWQIAAKLAASPDLKWVVIREGLRKEQIGEILASTFNWSDEEINQWNMVYTQMKADYIEGTYFPDTYLIPVDEGGLAIAERMTRRFDEKFAPYVSQFAEQNIQWTTGLKMASLIQRETAAQEDMPIIAGILWNRLAEGMKLEIDATVQYARGKAEAGWWAPIQPEDIINIDSPFNTYKYRGLPPYPIANPGIDAIEAVLHPAATDCLFYLHDHNRQIHCAKTYAEHKANIEQYLNN
jgi:UPF0755 protein